MINKFAIKYIEKRKNLSIIQKSTTYSISKNAKIKNIDIIKRHDPIYYLNYKREKTRDIVQGLPKIEELLEAKKTNVKNNLHLKIKKVFLKAKKKYIEAIATRKTIQKLQKYLVNEVQDVYKSQGVNISNKHIEIIIKQMTSKVIITNQESTEIITGEIIDINKIEKINNEKLKKICYEPILVGISKLSLLNTSFIAQACFQETTKVLAKSALEGKIDWLYGLKENIILGNIIPAGTGFKS